MVGNDLVDLQIAKSQSNWRRKGFLEKQFTIKEQQLILKNGNSFNDVWRLWSMKEAAYKIYTQQHKKRFFAPQKFECSFISESEGMVSFEKNKFFTTTFLNALYCYTIAQKTNDKLVVFSSVGLPENIGCKMKQKLQELTGVLAEEMTQIKSSVGAPLYYQKEKLLTNSCSISHHGNYGAFAFTLQNES